jgi:hypothetical protein
MEKTQPKPWYKSKTIWLNVAATALLFTEGLGQVMTGFTPLLGAWAVPFSFGVAILNMFLRTITDQGIEK